MTSKPEDIASFTVLIPDGESNIALPVLRCLGEMKNVTSYVLSTDPWVRIRFSRYASQFYVFPKENGEKGRLEAIVDIVKNKKIDIVLPVDEPTIRLLSQHGETLSQFTSVVHLTKTETFDIASNKWLLSEWLKERQIPHPPTLLYKTDTGFEQSLADFVFPVLIKPIKGSGGEGIKYFENPLKMLHYFKENAVSKDYIVQKFIYGYDIDCSVLCLDGEILASTIQKKFIDESLDFGPSGSIDFLHDPNTYNIVKEVVGEFNWTGIVHFDLRYDEQDNQVKVIEMNPRYWASILGSMAAGVNFPYLACLLGLKHDLPKVTANTIRIVDADTALKILVKGILQRDKTKQKFDKSIFKIGLRDPFPALFKVCFQFFHKMGKKNKAA